MLDVGSDSRIYLCTGYTDMRKGINGLSLLAQSILSYMDTNKDTSKKQKIVEKMKQSYIRHQRSTIMVSASC